MTTDLRDLVADLPAPWDELTVRQAIYLRHRVALVPHLAIAQQYGVAESAVRRALQRAAAQFGLAREAELVSRAAQSGVAPLAATGDGT